MFNVKHFFPRFIWWFQKIILSLQHKITKLKFTNGFKRNNFTY